MDPLRQDPTIQTPLLRRALTSLALHRFALAVLLALAYPLGVVLARVGDANAPAVPGMGWLGKLERLLYRAAGIARQDGQPQGQGWKTYAIALLVFNALGALSVYGLQRLQAFLPLNPQGLGNVSADSTFNTAVSFAANTNWQGYSGEQTMSYLTQMLVLTGQNFFSAATGIAVCYALIRGFSSRSVKSIGNFWVYVTASISCTSWYAEKFWITPCPARNTASTTDNGSSTYKVARVTSAQKLPIDLTEREEKPRISA